MAGLALFLLAAAAACGDPTTGTKAAAPIAPVRPSAAILDGANAGNAHFFFLPPLVKAPATSGASDPTASPTVVVCEWLPASGGAPAHCGSVVAQFSRTQGTGAEVIRYDVAGTHYIVNWNTTACVTGPCTLDPAKMYRLRVLIGVAELGYADVDVVSNGSELKNIKTGDIIALVNGRTLPIKFRVEQGAVTVVTAGAPATVGAGGGQIVVEDTPVALTLAPGALANNTPITVARAPNAPSVGVWSTPVELGPDGTQFAAPVVLTLGFDASAVSQGLPISALRIVTLVDGGWVPVDGSVLNVTDATVSAPLAHFSTYAVGSYPYQVTLYPNDVNSFPASTQTVAIGDSVRVAGSLSSYGNPLAGYGVIIWADPAMKVLSPGHSVTNADGSFISPPIVARAVGTANVGTAYADGGIVAYTIQNRLHLSPDSGAVGAGFTWRFPLSSAVATASDVPVTVSVTGTALKVAEPGTATAAIDGRPATFTLPAGAPEKLLYLVGEAGPGGPVTIIASSPGMAPDTAVLRVAPSTFQLAGVPTTLQVGDSAAVELVVAGPQGEFGGLARPISATLESTGLVARSGIAGSPNLTTFTVPQRVSPTFYLKATAVGTATLTVAHPWFQSLTVSIPVTPAASQFFVDQTQWSAAAPSPRTDVTFTTRDDGTPITNPSAQEAFTTLSLRGATFLNAGTYHNQVLTQFPNAPVRVNLPAGTRGVAADLGVFYPIAGTYTVRLSNGAVFTRSSSTRPSGDFVGVVTTEPITWIEFTLDNTYLVLSKLTYAGPPTPAIWYGDPSAWAAAAPDARLDVTFATRDDGSPITSPTTDMFFGSLTLRGVTFLNVNSYYNQLLYAQSNPLRVRLPAGTRAVAADLWKFYTGVGTYTVRLSTGEVIARPNAEGTPEFVGVVTPGPLDWIEFSFDTSVPNALILKKLSLGAPPTMP